MRKFIPNCLHSITFLAAALICQSTLQPSAFAEHTKEHITTTKETAAKEECKGEKCTAENSQEKKSAEKTAIDKADKSAGSSKPTPTSSKDLTSHETELGDEEEEEIIIEEDDEEIEDSSTKDEKH